MKVILICEKTGRWWSLATEGLALKKARNLGLKDYTIEKEGVNND